MAAIGRKSAWICCRSLSETGLLMTPPLLKGWSRVRLWQRVTASLFNSTVLTMPHVLEIPEQPQQVLKFPCRSQNKCREKQLPRKRKHQNWSSKQGLISEISGSHEVCSCASRPVEAMVWISVTELVKSIADLKDVMYYHQGKVAEQLRGS